MRRAGGSSRMIRKRAESMKHVMDSLPPELRASSAEIEDAVRLTGEITVAATGERIGTAQRRQRRILAATPSRSTRRDARAATPAPAPLDEDAVIDLLPPSLYSTAGEIDCINGAVPDLDVDALVRGGARAPSRSRDLVNDAAAAIARTAPRSAASAGPPPSPDDGHWARSSPLFSRAGYAPGGDRAAPPPPRAFFLASVGAAPSRGPRGPAPRDLFGASRGRGGAA